MDKLIKAKIIPPQDHPHGAYGVSVTLKSGQVCHFPTEEIHHVNFHADVDQVDVEIEEPVVVEEKPAESGEAPALR